MDEYIRRGEAIEQFEDSTSAIPEKLARIRIKEIPAADVVEVRHGQKIDISSSDVFFHWYKCSVCGYDGLFLEDEYCSRCGAKLDVPVTNVGTWAVTENEIDTSR